VVPLRRADRRRPSAGFGPLLLREEEEEEEDDDAKHNKGIFVVVGDDDDNDVATKANAFHPKLLTRQTTTPAINTDRRKKRDNIVFSYCTTPVEACGTLLCSYRCCDRYYFSTSDVSSLVVVAFGGCDDGSMIRLLCEMKCLIVLKPHCEIRGHQS
jgi:hypothetical protein